MIRFIIAACTAAVLACALLPGAASAQEASVRVTITPVAPVAIGERPVVRATITDERAKPLAAVQLVLSVDGRVAARMATDVAGVATFRVVSENLRAGEHAVTVAPANRARWPAEARASMRVLPAIVAIETVPPLAGMRFAVGPASGAAREVIVAGADGIAYATASALGRYRIEALAGDLADPTTRAHFSRWHDQSFSPAREVSIGGHLRLQAGYEVEYLIQQRFKDLGGSQVAPSRVRGFELLSSIGTRMKLADGEPRWLLGSRVVRGQHGLEVADILYSVLAVDVDGANVVNGAQQRFIAAEQRDWEITLLLYTMRVRAKDAIFQFRIGSGIELEDPKGNVVFVPFDGDGEVEIHDLARGDYRMRVKARGMSPWQPVSLSRTQEVEVTVISYLDLGVVAACGLAALSTLVYVRLRRQRTHKKVARLALVGEDAR